MTTSTPCTHLDQVQITDIPTRAEVPGCEDCLKTGGRWMHLRVCLTCGKVGCCDDSPNRHASAHARGDHHPLIRSIEPDEEWVWCFEDETAFVLRFD
jgi:uncharacterized UBP type Zn finger protein